MAFDANRNRIVLFGGFDGLTQLQDTWEWDGTAWLQRTPADLPPARQDAAFAHDSARGRTVLFSGLGGSCNGLDDLWEWDGTDWHPGPAAADSADSASIDGVAPFRPRH